MGNLTKSKEIHWHSFKIKQSLYLENHSSVADSLNNLGNLYINMGNLTKAEEFL